MAILIDPCFDNFLNCFCFNPGHRINMTESKSPGYRRLPENERKQLLIDATLKCLANYSLSGTTVRRIAELAGVTPGLVTHHFNSKEELIAAAYEYLSEQYLPKYDSQNGHHTDDAIARLRHYIGFIFQPEKQDHEMLKIWTGFWTLVLFDKRLRAVHRSTANRTRQHVSVLLKAALISSGRSVDQQRLDDLVIAILSLLDGIWLARGLDPDLLDADKARQMALEMVAARLDLPELLNT